MGKKLTPLDETFASGESHDHTLGRAIKTVETARGSPGSEISRWVEKFCKRRLPLATPWSIRLLKNGYACPGERS
jgi:hypothetical protein